LNSRHSYRCFIRLRVVALETADQRQFRILPQILHKVIGDGIIKQRDPDPEGTGMIAQCDFVGYLVGTADKIPVSFCASIYTNLRPGLRYLAARNNVYVTAPSVFAITVS